MFGHSFIHDLFNVNSTYIQSQHIPLSYYAGVSCSNNPYSPNYLIV